ncbi:MAG TPA: NAD(P)H-hydrate dehydratase, partial [Pyrinomonadaceae bacterium]|nr:NAD(P)H-hydrate dehydratase [Pyrinomonadaceae bacterium]
MPSIILMENAAHAVARVITEELGTDITASILCGPGNNGGDGAAVARILWSKGADVDVYLFGAVDNTSGDARTNFDAIKKIGERDPPFAPYLFLHESREIDVGTQQRILRSHVVVDAVYGTGLSRPLPANISELFKALGVRTRNAVRGHRPLLISVDIPSGLNADSGYEFQDAFQSDCTVTFTSPKAANVLAPNYKKNGKLIVEQIGSPYELLDEVETKLEIWEKHDINDFLRRLKFTDDSYKNKRGHALVIAGSETYSGAAVLAGNSAIRSGVGLVTLACPAEAKTEIASRLLPEVILATLRSPEFDELAPKANAIAVGPGLSATDPDIESLVRKVVEERTTPVIVDAGALWFFNPPSGVPTRDADDGVRVPLILTPHEGEFMRLLGTDDKDAMKDRVATVREFSQANNVILVLKGERVLIGHPDGRVVVNPTGNSGLGKAGNGDTLTGVLAGFCAQA